MDLSVRWVDIIGYDSHSFGIEPIDIHCHTFGFLQYQQQVFEGNFTDGEDSYIVSIVLSPEADIAQGLLHSRCEGDGR